MNSILGSVVPLAMFLFQHLDEATILEEAKNLDMEKSLEILKSHGTVQVYFIVCL